MGELAMKMVEENVSKVVASSDASRLFLSESSFDAFLLGTAGMNADLLKAARAVAPVTYSNGVLSFIHKTIMEHLCAAGLARDLHRVFAYALQLSSLKQIVKLLEKKPTEHEREMTTNNALLNAVETLTQDIAGLEEKVDEVTATVKRIEALVKKVAGGPSALEIGDGEDGDRLTQKALKRLVEQIGESHWASVELNREDAIRDFLTDLLVQDSAMFSQFRVLVLIADHRCSDG